MRARHRVVTVVASVLTIAILFPASQASSGACWNYKDKEKKFARKINASRANNDQRRLRLDRHLSRVARAHTKAMARRGDLYHTNRLGSKVTRWIRLGENVGFGNRVGSLHNAFMASPGHRANILGRYRWVGIGTRVVRGRLWVTVVFESRRDPGTTLQMPKC
jgi:uncharacterized protein YkwD